jgi:hypothetical protein
MLLTLIVLPTLYEIVETRAVRRRQAELTASADEDELPT